MKREQENLLFSLVKQKETESKNREEERMEKNNFITNRKKMESVVSVHLIRKH